MSYGRASGPPTPEPGRATGTFKPAEKGPMTHKTTSVSMLLALGGLLLTLPWHLSAQDPVRLSLTHPWQGHVEMNQVRHLEVELQAGEFVRAMVEMDGDRDQVMASRSGSWLPGIPSPGP